MSAPVGADGRGKAATLGMFLLGSYRTLPGTISPPELEEALSRAGTLAGDMRGDLEGLERLREHLQGKGFTAAPASAELVGLLNEVPEELLQGNPARAGASFRDCVGLSRAQLRDAERLLLSPSIAGIVLASLAQLQLALPKDAVVLGPLEGTFRGVRGGITWLHNDEIRTSEVYVEQALFPLPRAGLDDEAPVGGARGEMFSHYEEFKARAEGCFPGLGLPEVAGCDLADDHGLRSFTQQILSAVSGYHLGAGRSAGDELVPDDNIYRLH